MLRPSPEASNLDHAKKRKSSSQRLLLGTDGSRKAVHFRRKTPVAKSCVLVAWQPARFAEEHLFRHDPVRLQRSLRMY
jgi:hypothetical protein